DSLGRLIVMGGRDTNGNDSSDVWRSQQLGSPDTVPVLTHVPATMATYSAGYSSSIAATGNPQPVYQLVSGPAGMTVDYFTGAIHWTPQGLGQIGSIPVTIAATNYAGVTNYAFNISVPNPPPSIPTNFQLVSFNDNSATVSWSPEDPSVGPVTYSIAIPHPYHSPRGSGGGVNYQIVFSGITTNVFTFYGLAPGSRANYALSVSATNGSIGFGYSTWFGVATSAPQGPVNLWVTALTSTSISLSWPPSPGPAQSPFYSPIVSFTVMDHTSPSIPATNIPVLVNITTTNATVNGLTPGSTHYWYIAGVDAQGFASPLVYTVQAINPVPTPATLSTANSPATGGFQFNITPSAYQTTLVQATTNLQDPASWETIFTNPIAGAAINFTDPAAASFPSRFYRVVSP
ncbi:MAG TPA: fibronectin type III domain-containing protein, partial [Candidatus Acidoferrum sp.]|nr:fibronectin type III domain-containing protein [Candidatus Acidoferrum sp.]